LSPHATKKIPTKIESTKILFSLDVSAFTIQNLYCKFVSIDRVVYSPTFSSSFKTVECNITSTSDFNLELLNVLLVMKEMDYYVISNNVSFLYVLDATPWSTRFIEPNLNYTLNFTVPNTLFTYNVQLLINQTKHLLNCTSIIGSEINCYFPNLLAELVVLPSLIRSTMIVNYQNFNISFELSSLIYSERMNFIHLKPFLISFDERKSKSFRFISNVDRQLNPSSDFQYFAMIHQSLESKPSSCSLQLNSNEYQIGLDPKSHFQCNFNLFGTPNENYNVSFWFNSTLGTKLLTLQSSIIFVSPYSLVHNFTQGIVEGGHSIGSTLIENLRYPTLNYNSYDFSLRIFDRNVYYAFNEFFMKNGSITCVMPNVSGKITNHRLVSKFKLELFVNSLPSITFQPYFEIFSNF
jgi:hypothetical protein